MQLLKLPPSRMIRLTFNTDGRRLLALLYAQLLGFSLQLCIFLLGWRFTIVHVRSVTYPLSRQC